MKSSRRLLKRFLKCNVQSSLKGENEISFFGPAEITKNYVDTGYKKATQPVHRLLCLSILAGAFVALASQGTNVAIHTIQSVGLSKVLAGALFPAALMIIVLTGAELFTGNMLIIVSVLDGKTKFTQMLRNWFLVYIGNFIGSMIIVIFILLSGQLGFSNGLLGGFTIKIASYKVNLSFVNAFIMGVLCNILVCIAVWMASAAKDVSGKLLAIFFPIWLFVASGFEHSVANMYYIPAGILAKSNPSWANAAISLSVTTEQLNALNWGSFIINNLVPVTLGNIIGGAFFIGFAYWYAATNATGDGSRCRR